MNSLQAFQQPFPTYSDKLEHLNRWKALAQEIHQDRAEVFARYDRQEPCETLGELIILGSGIETVGFTHADELYIKEADKVFYCVADPATLVWLKNLRPDGYDLYVLYGEGKQRYVTYMQMTEAMLHYVRKGQKVVGIYYGHPGVFVLSTHRAVQIGRQEGHRVVMRAAVSALDTLCADIGIDPSTPGMQTFEATDVLIRQRRLDPELHLVLWQVGLVGDLGYRREGSLNTGFTLLLDYLEGVYGPEQRIINYIGSRYPGIDPICEEHTIASLRLPEVQSGVTGISTFYLPPIRAAKPNYEMLLKLGLIKPGQSVKETSDPIRIIDSYGARERQAIESFAAFSVPSSYHWQEDTPGARFILALRESGDLRDLYRHNPREAMARWGGGLSEDERRRLSYKQAGPMQLAAKRLKTKVSEKAFPFLNATLTLEAKAKGLLKAVRSGADPRASFAAWCAAQGYGVDLADIESDLHLFMRKQAYVWSGVYVDADKKISLVVYGRTGKPEATSVFVNGRPVRATLQANGTFVWSAHEGQPTSGALKTDSSDRGERRLVGCIWTGTKAPTSQDRIYATEHRLTTDTPLASFTGAYALSGSKGPQVMIKPGLVEGHWRMAAYLEGGSLLPAEPRLHGGNIHIGDLRVPLSSRLKTTEQLLQIFAGSYRLKIQRKAKIHYAHMQVRPEGILLDGEAVEVSLEGAGGHHISWRNGPRRSVPSAQIAFLVDPITLAPLVFGQTGIDGDGKTANIRAMGRLCEERRAARVTTPDLGLAPWVWQPVVQAVAASQDEGGLFLWSAWSRTRRNLTRLRKALDLMGIR